MEVVRTKPLGGIFVADTYNSANAAFIAACAGPAEAGWRATIAAIDLHTAMIEQEDRHRFSPAKIVSEGRAAILAAWEGQV